MWPAIIAALVGAAATTAGQALMSPGKPKLQDPTNPLTAAQQQEPSVYAGQPDILAQYLAGSQARKAGL